MRSLFGFPEESVLSFRALFLVDLSYHAIVIEIRITHNKNGIAVIYEMVHILIAYLKNGIIE